MAVPRDIDKLFEPSSAGKITVLKDVATTVGFLLLPSIALRALVVSNFDSGTAIALVQFTPPTVFALVAFIPLAGLATLALSFWFFYRAGSRLAKDLEAAAKATGYGLAGLLAAVPTLMGIDQLTAIPALFMFSVAALFGYTSKAKTRTALDIEYITINLRAFIVGGVGVAVLLTVGTRGPWVAPEKVLTKSQGSVVVYVLSEPAPDIVYFDPIARQVLRMPKSNISYRQFCYFDDDLTTGSRLLRVRKAAPSCDSQPDSSPGN